MKNSLVLVYAIGFLIGVAYGMHGPILPIFSKNVIGATYSELGLIGFANFIPYMFIPLFVGILLNRFNNGYLLSFGVLLNSTSIFLLSTAQSVPEIMGFRILTGIAHGFFWPPCESIIANVSEKRDRVKNIGKFAGFFVSGFMIGPLIGTILLENVDLTYRLLFQITAFILASAIISAVLVSKNHITNPSRQFSISSIKEMVRFPEIIAILIFCNATFATVLTIYPAFLNDKQMSATDIEVLFFVFGIARVATFGVVSKFERKTPLSILLAVATISSGMIISFVSESMIYFGISLLLLGFGFSLFFPLTLGVVLSKTRAKIHGTIIGAYETTFGIGWVIGPISAGFISDHYSSEMPYLVFFAVGALITTMILVRKKSLRPDKIVDEQ